MVAVDLSCSGFMEAGSRRSLGLRPMASSMGVLPLKVTCVFLTLAALRINWAGVICARVVWSKFLEAVSTSAKRNFLEQSYIHVSSVWPCCMWSCCAFGRMPACREDGGKPHLHKSPSETYLHREYKGANERQTLVCCTVCQCTVLCAFFSFSSVVFDLFCFLQRVGVLLSRLTSSLLKHMPMGQACNPPTRWTDHTVCVVRGLQPTLAFSPLHVCHRQETGLSPLARTCSKTDNSKAPPQPRWARTHSHANTLPWAPCHFLLLPENGSDSVVSVTWKMARMLCTHDPRLSKVDPCLCPVICSSAGNICAAQYQHKTVHHKRVNSKPIIIVLQVSMSWVIHSKFLFVCNESVHHGTFFSSPCHSATFSLTVVSS